VENEALYAIQNIPKYEKYRNILNPAPLYHLPETSVISDAIVKDNNTS